MSTIIYRFLLIFLFSALLSGAVKSQSLGMESISVPDTVFTQSTYDLIFNIKNTDTTFINGFVNLNMKVGSGAPFIIASDSVHLPPNAVHVFNVTGFQFDTGGFIPGYDVVVVWPTGSNFSLSNDLTFGVFVINNTGIPSARKKAPESNLFFPNPAKKEVSIRAELKIEQVRIFDSLGKEFISVFSNPSSLDVSGLKQGIYFIDVYFLGGQHQLQKLIISD